MNAPAPLMVKGDYSAMAAAPASALEAVDTLTRKLAHLGAIADLLQFAKDREETDDVGKGVIINACNAVSTLADECEALAKALYDIQKPPAPEGGAPQPAAEGPHDGPQRGPAARLVTLQGGRRLLGAVHRHVPPDRPAGAQAAFEGGRAVRGQGQGRPNVHQLALELSGGSGGSSRVRSKARARGLCRLESPLEKQLAFALCSVEEDFRWRKPGDHAWRVGTWPRRRLELLAHVTVGRYRADLAVAPVGWRFPNLPEIVIEVDGHGYHYSRKEQVEHDRQRDHHIVSQGARILRFTGGEVWRDAGRRAEEVLKIASGLR